MNIGQRIIDEIIKQGMINITAPDPATTHVITWNGNAAEQLTALVSQEMRKLRDALIEIKDLDGRNYPEFEDQLIAVNRIAAKALNPWT